MSTADTRFMEIALQHAESAAAKGQTLGFRRVVFAARGTDVPTYRPLLGADLVEAAAWVNRQPDWAPLEVLGDFMRARSLEIIAAFPWTPASSKAPG